MVFLKFSGLGVRGISCADPLGGGLQHLKNDRLAPGRLTKKRACPKNKFLASPLLCSDNHCVVVFSDAGGERGIRTPGTLIEYGSLANCWFQPLTHLSGTF